MKNIYIQKLRGILIFLVILIHSIGISNIEYENYILIFLRTICNVAVPIFFFLSGYYFNIEKYEKEGKKYIIKKVKRLLIPLIIWNIIYYLILKKSFMDIILFKSAAHLYYVVVLIQLIIITPLINYISKYKVSKIILYLITPLYLLVYRALWIKYNFTIPLHEFYIFGWIIYYLLGLKYRKINNHKEYERKDLIKIIVLLLLVFSFNIYIYIKLGFEYSLSQMNIVNMLLSITVIHFINKFMKINTKENLLSKIGDKSFGIYFFHILILKIVAKVLGYIISDVLILTLAKAVLTLVISYFVIYIFSKITNKKLDVILGFE